MYSRVLCTGFPSSFPLVFSDAEERFLLLLVLRLFLLRTVQIAYASLAAVC